MPEVIVPFGFLAATQSGTVGLLLFPGPKPESLQAQLCKPMMFVIVTTSYSRGEKYICCNSARLYYSHEA